MNSRPIRKVFSTGEVLTLFGMGLCVISAALIWGTSAPAATSPSAVAAIFVSRLTKKVSGFDLEYGWLPVGWTVVLCAVLCGSLLLVEPAPRLKSLLLIVQVILATVVLSLVILHIELYPGRLVALAGSFLLLWGAVARYR
jgi:hypothetical protein